jgi:RNA polymerase sigma-70 factor, ECF subfamily
MAMSAVQQGDERLPFAEVITLHQKTVYGYLLRFTRNSYDAQDLFQETFLRAYRAYAALPANADLRAWLLRIAVNLSKNYLRDRQRRSRVLVDEEQGQGPDGELIAAAGTDTEGIMISRQTAQTLLAAIEALPFHQRAALIQHQFEGLDYQTIAANLECSLESARAHVYQALRKLRLSLAHSSANTKEV